ncbi:hypothetical protein SAMN05216303_1011326 [Rhodoferax sp. OV413]|uniref:hypothetical protein n=1 Tax=Rhodoferax sp. OV413 TaxID=1855285 RepID=UPI000883B2D6|nr:hypothetical protein [Rhodoferax sp. OV413]SDO40137.1 hypothetical protein SAMN05216303_1011326 [Rhodoferax sp. OV413]
MLIFLDTEFTRLTYPDLISVGMVTEDGRGLYSERNDFHAKDCSLFVQETVLPLLGRIPGATCSRMDLTHRLREWLAQFPEPPTFVFDSHHDWHLLALALLGRPKKDPPGAFGKQLFVDSSVFAHPAFEAAAHAAYTEELPIHHALADARALMAGYRAWSSATGGTRL